jgi:ATP-dependent protease HslVU (ClpYQ) peptidase subunit
MTTILAIQGEDYCAIGSDSQWTDDYNRVGKMTQSKVIAIGNYFIGVAGDTRGANIIQYVFIPPQLPPKLSGNKLAKFMVSQFIPAYRDCLEQNGLGLPQYESNAAQASIDSLVCANGVIYQIDADYSTEMDTNNLYAIGSGAHYGLGAMQMHASNKKISQTSAKRVLLKSLTISARFDSNSGSPFHTFIQTRKT